MPGVSLCCDERMKIVLFEISFNKKCLEDLVIRQFEGGYVRR